MNYQYIILATLLIAAILLLFTTLALYKIKQKHKILINDIKKLADFKEQTSNMIIHDLKVPLATLMNLELILDETLQRKMVKQASKRMMLLVQNVLDVYKYENTQIIIKKESQPINKLITDSIAEFEIMTEIKKISFKLILETDITVLVDPTLILRVFSNILSNSIKFSPTQGVIEIQTTVSDNVLKITFRNQGPGIPKKQQALIFDRFEQAEAKNLGKLPSTGLGLTFCKIAIDAHKGAIGVVSNTEKGAEFWLELPC